ncbi:polysaccharide biosynthesis/export family protein [Methylobacterium sp. JK268]
MRGRLLGTAVTAAVMTAIVSAGPARAGEQPYRLGAQDRIRLRVTEWRAGRGETYEWAALSGEYTVDSAGRLTLPLVGDLAAAGLDTRQVAAQVAERLQQRIGLIARPDASVEIARYRPFYVVGQVEKPGAYPFQPDLTVLQAVSLAGGFSRTSDPDARVSREQISLGGELLDVGNERLALLARRARLEAEMRDDAALRFPDEVRSARGAGSAEAVREEQALFEARRTALRSQTDALEQAKTLVVAEIDTLQQKIAAQDRQIALVRKELASVTTLVQQGLSVTQRQLTLDQTLAQFESAKLDNLLAVSRSRQDINRMDRSILDLRNQRQSGVLADLRETQQRLVKLQQRADTLRNLVTESATALAARQGGRPAAPRFAIMRKDEGGATEIRAGENDPVRPDDVLKVEAPRENAPTPASAGTPGPVAVR